MFASRIVRRSRLPTSAKASRHASACQDLLSRSLATTREDEPDEQMKAHPRQCHLRLHPTSVSSADWPRTGQQRLTVSRSVPLESFALSSSVGQSRSPLRSTLLLNADERIPPSLGEVYRAPLRVEQTLSPRAMRRLIYTATVRAMGGPSTMNRSPFEQTMHRVVHRACFSTQPEPPKEGTTSSTGSSTTGGTNLSSSSASFSTSASPVEQSYAERAREAIENATKSLVNFIFKLPGVMWFYLTHPRELRTRLQELKEAAKKEAHHYWMGSKLLAADVRTAYKLLQRTLQGSALTRRERKQLLRTVSDLFRLVPFSMFVLIPFMEFALPFALRLFPNMLPSTFQDSLKEEESMKRELKSRIAMAEFFQETLQDLVKEQKKDAQSRKEEHEEHEDDNQDHKVIAAKQEESAADMLEFLEKARSGEIIPPEVIIRYSSYFQDDLTLDNMPRMQLINMCKYMNIAPYGADSFLRFQLRYKIRSLKEDDQRILWEGIDSLTKMELREACRERGMRSTGLSKDGYKRALQQWLDLSVNKNVPIALLIMSRTFFLRDEMATVGQEDDGSKSIADAISGLDRDVVNEVVLEVATSEEKKSNPDVMKIKLEVVEQQNERIREEQEEREAALRLKKKEHEQQKEKPDVVFVEATVVDEEPEFSTSSASEAYESDKTTITTFEEEKAAAASAPDVEQREVDGSTQLSPSEEEEAAAEDHDEDETELSTQEMEAISQLVTPDPVISEREHLERIKAAMKADEGSEEVFVPGDEPVLVEATDVHDALEVEDVVGDKQRLAATAAPLSADEAETKAAKEVPSETQTLGEAVISVQEKKLEESARGNESLDKAINRLKSKVESMVDKIETQLSDAEVKIGDKLHFLDKDMDGIVTSEEMALCLQQVLKRELTFEEALHIASEMDENKDGVLTVAEFIKWVETNKLVNLLEEGRDTDIDSILAKYQNEEQSSSESATEKN